MLVCYWNSNVKTCYLYVKLFLFFITYRLLQLFMYAFCDVSYCVLSMISSWFWKIQREVPITRTEVTGVHNFITSCIFVSNIFHISMLFHYITRICFIPNSYFHFQKCNKVSAQFIFVTWVLKCFIRKKYDQNFRQLC